MAKIKRLCILCKERLAVPLTAERKGIDGIDRVYVNAQNVRVFCTVRCAANYGLLFHDWSGDREDIDDEE